MINLNRRRFIGSAAGLVALGVLGAPAITGRARLRVMVIGGGPGGVAAATEIRSTVPDAQILLVEADPTRLAWPQSGSFISGRRDAGDFATLASVGVDVSIDEIRHIDWQLGVAEALSGRQMGFDRVVMAPGIAFRDEGISGYDAEAAALFPHAWTGRSGIAALAADITAMDRNGWVIIRVPEGGMRYPLGPYRRAGEIAAFLETENPGARVILLDHSQAHPAKQALLKQLQSRFGTMIDHVDGRRFGPITRIDVASRTIIGADKSLCAEVINFIPAQSAGRIATVSGLSDATGWCPVRQRTGQSEYQAKAYLIGEMPTDMVMDSRPGITRAAQMIARHIAQTV